MGASRIHQLNGFGKNTWVKRDDELSFGMAGSKVRKFRSLMPRLRAEGIEEVVAIGGARSNNLLAVFQSCFEQGVRVTPFVLGPPASATPKPDWLYLFCDESKIHWVAREDWHRVEEMARRYQKETNPKAFVLPEGSYHPYAFDGCLSLAEEIYRFQEDSNLIFDRIFVDAGTGLMAQALLAGLSRRLNPPEVIVVMLADIEESFPSGLERVFSHCGLPLGSLGPFQLLQPPVGRSFGSAPRRLLKEIQKLAREEGILTDPVYSAKLFLTARGLTDDASCDLLIHSGGALSLGGFLSRF